MSRESGAGDALVGVRSLLDADLLVARLAGAAAHAEEPEETGGNAESDTEPHDGEHLLAESGIDVVWLEDGLEDTGEKGVDGGCGRRGGDDEDGLSGGDDGGNEAAPAGEDGEESNDELGGAENKGNAERPDHPAGCLLVCVEALLEIRSKNLLRTGVLELPDAEGIEPEVGLCARTVGDGLDTGLVILVTLAVRPKTDLVEVLQLLGRGCAL